MRKMSRKITATVLCLALCLSGVGTWQPDSSAQGTQSEQRGESPSVQPATGNPGVASQIQQTDRADWGDEERDAAGNIVPATHKTRSVSAKRAGVKLSVKSLILKKGKKARLTLTGAKGKVRWKSSNRKVVKVNKRGLIKAKRPGTAIVTAVNKKKKYNCRVYVPKTVKIGTGKVTEDQNEVKIKDIEVGFMPGAIDKASKVTVTKTAYMPKLVGSSVALYDVSLSGSTMNPETDLMVVEIPYKAAAGSLPFAAEYVESTGKYIPAVSDYHDGKVVIYADHPGKYAVCAKKQSASAKSAGKDGKSMNKAADRPSFDRVVPVMMHEDTTRAYIDSYYSIPNPAYDGDDSIKETIANLKSQDMPESCVQRGAKMFGKLTGLASNVMSIVNDAGINLYIVVAETTGFVNNNFYGTLVKDEVGAALGGIGFLIGYLDAVSKMLQGDYTGAALAGCNTGVSTLMAEGVWYLNHVLGGASAGMAAASFTVAFVAYSLSSFISEAISTNEAKWMKIYNKAYSQDNQLKRTLYNWQKILLPILTNMDLTEEQRNAAVEAEVDDYVNKIWNDDEIKATWLGPIDDGRRPFPGGDWESLKVKLSNQKKAELYDKENGPIPKVIKWYYHNQQKIAKKAELDNAKKVADMLNHEITIQFFDGTRSDGTTSLFEGYSVGWKTIPKRITDKKNCSVKLNSSGEGELEFNNYAFLAYGFEPIVVLYDKNGQAVDEFKFEWTMEGAKVDIGKESLKLSPNNQTIKMGEKGSVMVKGININKVSFTSGDEKIAKIGGVDKSSVTIEGVGPGTTTITATAGELSDSVKVTVIEDTVVLSPAEVTLTDTKTKQTIFLKNIVDGVEKNIKITSWKVTDAGKILATTKNSDGSITVSASGKGSGTATISCTYNKETYTCTVTVALPDVTVSLNTTEIKITDTTTAHELYLQQTVGETTEKIKDIKWSIPSDAKSFLNATTKDNSLILYGKGNTGGTTTVSCSYDGKTYSCTVTVAFTVAAYLDNTSITINDPDYVPSINLMETGNDGKVLKVKTTVGDWKVSDTSVVSIKGTGSGGIYVTGLKAGTATITITYKGQTFTCSVTVTFGEYFLNNTAITLTSPDDAIGVHLSMTKDGKTTVVQTSVDEWNNSNPSVVKLESSSSGGVFCWGLKNGTSTISITYGGVSYKCVVTVNFAAATPTPKPTPTATAKPGTVNVTMTSMSGKDLCIKYGSGEDPTQYPYTSITLLDKSNNSIPVSDASWSCSSGCMLEDTKVETGVNGGKWIPAKKATFTETGTQTVTLVYDGTTYHLNYYVTSGSKRTHGITQYFLGSTECQIAIFG